MKKAFIVISLATMFSSVGTITYADTTAATQAPSVAGNYKCQWSGSLLNNSNFSLSITKTKDTYNLEWDDSKGSPVLYGTGLTSTDINNLLTASFWGVTDNTLAGVLSITIKPDGSLQGNWISQSGQATGTQTCTKGS